MDEVGQDRFRQSMAKQRSIATSVIVLAALAVVAATYLSSRLLIPIVISALGYLTLRPLVHRICQLGVPQTLASATVIALVFAAVAAIGR